MSSSEYGNFGPYLAGILNIEGSGGSTPPADIAEGIDASVDIDSILSQLQTIAGSFPQPPYLTQDILGGGIVSQLDTIIAELQTIVSAFPQQPYLTQDLVSGDWITAVIAVGTTSDPFTMTGRLNYMVASAAAGTPVLTLQAQNYDDSWFDTSVTATLGASVTIIESDTLAKVAGLCGITNFRFSISAQDANTIIVAIASRDGVNAE